MKPLVPARYYDPEALDPRNRRDGISAMLRVRDGAEFLRPGLESCIDVFDEIVAVHHQCSDDTPRILHEYEAAYPGRFKVYEYPHEVFPPGTEEHAAQDPESPHTIAALCNYALSKTTRRFAIKHDADHLYMPRFAEIADFVRSGRAGGCSVPVIGLNLARSRAGDLGVHRRYPINGGRDFLFFPVSRDTFYVHQPEWEIFIQPQQFSIVSAGFGFWHLKYLERHHGIDQFLRLYTPYDYIKEVWGYDEPLPDERPAPGDCDQWRGFITYSERNLEVISLEEFIALFGGKDSPLISARQLRWPRWVNGKLRGCRFLTVQLVAPLVLFFANAYCKIPSSAYCKIPSSFFDPMTPHLRARSVRRDLCGLSLPAESELTMR